jgi:hypothetical protein
LQGAFDALQLHRQHSNVLLIPVPVLAELTLPRCQLILHLLNLLLQTHNQIVPLLQTLLVLTTPFINHPRIGVLDVHDLQLVLFYTIPQSLHLTV